MADSRHADASPPAAEVKWIWVVLATAAAYAAVGWLALNLALPEGYASPLFPSAGIALAATLVYGRRALPGVLLGSFVLNIVHGASQPMSTATTLLPLVIAFGATLQAAAGASLVRRFVSDPLVLNSGQDIIRAGLLGGLLSSLVSASVATPALLAAGQLQVADWPTFWATWWVGDLLGLLIGTPLALTLIGRPRADWQPRRRSLGVPLLLALALLATAVVELRHLDDERLRARFERDADRMASEAQARLRTALYALQALHSVARGKSDWDQAGLAEASRWWLNPAHNLQATGYSVLVPQARIAAFEALARTEGLVDFHVFSRDGGKALANDGEAIVVRQVEPRSLNASALGVNALSIPAARAAILATRRSGEPSASAPFELTQLKSNESGLVLYQALYAGAPADEQARQATFRALVFVTLRTDVALASLASEEQRYIHWCVVDPDPAASRRRLAGPSGCDKASVPGTVFASRRVLALADREFELQLFAPKAVVPGSQRENTWLLTLSGLSAAALFGAFLLIVTGHTRRTERAVKSGTASLRREIDERTQVQQALLESEARLRSILNHVPIGVMFLDPAAALSTATRACAKCWGKVKTSCAGARWPTSPTQTRSPPTAAPAD